ncbi:MAG: hypothetical protein MnENMB40S_13290 [Rhizobiaceae bacterium MnEN-MB40S]|nr:MAG: hypothetical protein MnENMB40S_13290 [Rhizobiaceae bacterium MnEN-MB40S]
MSALKKRIRDQGSDIKWRTLEIAAWGEPDNPLIAKVRTLSLDEYKSWSERLKDGDPGERVLLVIDRLYDEKGKARIFDTASTDDYKLLRNDADPLVIGSIVAEIMRWGDGGAIRKN